VWVGSEVGLVVGWVLGGLAAELFCTSRQDKLYALYFGRYSLLALCGTAQKAQRPHSIPYQLSQPRCLALLLFAQVLQPVLQFLVRNQHVGVHAQENTHECLNGFKVFMRLQPTRQGVNEQREVIERDERSDLEIQSSGRQRLGVLEECGVCRQDTSSLVERNSQSLSPFSAANRRVKSLSRNCSGARRLVASSSSGWTADRSNRVSRPLMVGRKNGAFSGAFGGSLGLLRCYTLALNVRRGPRALTHLDRLEIQEGLPSGSRQKRHGHQAIRELFGCGVDILVLRCADVGQFGQS